MKAEELFIGAHVEALGKNRKIKSIVDRDTGVEVSFYDSNPVIVSLDMLQPIPLTPEILEKNGFSGEGYNMGIIGFHTDPIPEVKDGYEVFIWKDMCLEIKHGFTHLKRYTFYVHELQHALKLCGIDKEIVI